MQGYVYLLTHPFVPDLIKLETLTVDEQPKDKKTFPPHFSSFIVIDTIYVTDYVEAEQQIRQEFESLRLKNTANNAEFKLTIPVAMDILQRYQHKQLTCTQQNISCHNLQDKAKFFLQATQNLSEIVEKDKSHQSFFEKNGYIHPAAKTLLDQAVLENEQSVQFDILNKAFQLGSTEAGLKMAVHPHLLGYENTRTRIEHIVQTCKLIQAIPKTDPYYHQFWSHNFPEMIFLLIWALEDADNIEAFTLCDTLMVEFKSQFSRYLDDVFFPVTQLMLQQLNNFKKVAKRKQCIDAFNSKFAYQLLADDFVHLNQQDIEHLVQNKIETLYTVYEDLAYWLANLIYGVDFDTEYIKTILGKDYAQKIFLIQQALHLKQLGAKNYDNQKLEIDRMQACMSYLQYHQLYDQFSDEHAKVRQLYENNVIRKFTGIIKVAFTQLLKLKP